MRVLVVNPGSSSLKLSVLDGGETPIAAHEFDSTGGKVDRKDVAGIVRGLYGIGAVGHRFVHGGARFHGPVQIDVGVKAYLRSLTELAPLHQPAALQALDTIRDLLPDVPQVACFDTAFHSTLPPAAYTYALPQEWRQRHGLRRYGFHGLSHAYATRRAAQLINRPVESVATVTCHLGSGCSVAAVLGGRSVDTSMGFTPMEGLVMATRAGSVDPGMLLWLERRRDVSPERMEQVLDHESGLRGLAGTADMREVLAAAGTGAEGARLALDVYCHRLRAGIAAMAAAMGRLDCVVFTGGVGENAPPVREAAVTGLGFLGLEISEPANREGIGDRDISPPEALVRTLVVRAREDLEIARQVRELLQGPPVS